MAGIIYTFYLLIGYKGEARIVKTKPSRYQGFVYTVKATIPDGWNRPPVGYIQLTLPEPPAPTIEVSDPVVPEA